ncbi:GntR family transcriptional repressor for pyruvate dehydrogenase complex [Desulfosalsimonas propionicica]|uniref:GntR family transcriptional repressor for pyruvate dehydrogenase complex n=1 Tax=Desulfosalsimonas propionicica TaxID=332175 RepID=A0A7W0CBN7_9BACT|nr:FadR/GntR family transcriptional regulator [Desulfosalsimonas propionicica]MBA2882802.1 GntR family transcriptional repressor for pyruvate dehydrogenase complex [Desulfosalsimonas propionicica]
MAMEFNFQNVKQSRISSNIADQIQKAILNGDLKEGERLPSENDLITHFGVSKSSLREAFRTLEAYGLLEIKQGVNGGAFVKKVDIEVVKKGLENYLFFINPTHEDYAQFRIFNETQIVKVAASKITDKDIEELKENIREMEQEPDGERFYSDLDVAFHKKIAEIGGNPIVAVVVESVQSALIRLKRIIETDREFLDIVCRGHWEILEALEARDPEKASYFMLKHINEVEEGLRKCQNRSSSKQKELFKKKNYEVA